MGRLVLGLVVVAALGGWFQATARSRGTPSASEEYLAARLDTLNVHLWSWEAALHAERR